MLIPIGRCIISFTCFKPYFFVPSEIYIYIYIHFTSLTHNSSKLYTLFETHSNKLEMKYAYEINDIIMINNLNNNNI